MGFSHVHRPDGLNTLLSQGCILENGSHSGNGWRNLHSKDGGGRGEGGGASDCPGPAHKSTCGHVLFLTSSNTMELSICPRLLCEWKVNTWQYQRGGLESGCSLSLHDHWEIGVWAHAMPVGTGAGGGGQCWRGVVQQGHSEMGGGHSP